MCRVPGKMVMELVSRAHAHAHAHARYLHWHHWHNYRHYRCRVPGRVVMELVSHACGRVGHQFQCPVFWIRPPVDRCQPRWHRFGRNVLGHDCQQIGRWRCGGEREWALAEVWGGIDRARSNRPMTCSICEHRSTRMPDPKQTMPRWAHWTFVTIIPTL